MIRTQVSLEEDAYEAAKDEARRRGISLAELLQQALAPMLASGSDASGTATPSDQQPWMRFSGIVDSGNPDASLSVDEVAHGREKP